MTGNGPKAGSAAALFMAAINRLEEYLRAFEEVVPKPVTVTFEGSMFRRYREQTAGQALVLKFAGYISGLSAIDALLSKGLIYEIIPIQRSLDEMLDDMSLVSGSFETGRASELRERFLADFWHDTLYSREDQPAKAPKPPLRKEIREAVLEIFGLPEIFGVAGNDLYKFGSRFAHATAPPLLDLASPTNGRLQVRGTTHRGLLEAYIRYAWNNFYRGYLAAQAAAIGLGLRPLGLEIERERDRFAASSGSLANAD